MSIQLQSLDLFCSRVCSFGFGCSWVQLGAIGCKSHPNPTSCNSWVGVHRGWFWFLPMFGSVFGVGHFVRSQQLLAFANGRVLDHRFMLYFVSVVVVLLLSLLLARAGCCCLCFSGWFEPVWCPYAAVN